MAKRIQGTGPSDARIMVVGDMPLTGDTAQGLAFTSRTGELYKQFMMKSGIDPRKVYFTNVFKTRPTSGAEAFFLKGGMPEPDYINDLAELREEIEAVSPTVIVASGNLALWALGPRGTARWSGKLQNDERQTWVGIDDWRGSIVQGSNTAGGRKVIGTYSAESVQRKYSLGVILCWDFARIRHQSTFPEVLVPHQNIHIDPQGHERVEWRDKLLSGGILTFDIEAFGKDLLCVGMTTARHEACVVPIKRASDLQYVREILCSGVPLCAQNAMFDASVLEYWHGMEIMRYIKYDTMLAMHSAFIELPKDLGMLCSIYTEQPCYWTNIDWKKIKAGQQPISDVYQYNGLDVCVTHEVMEEQQKHDLLDPRVRQTFEFEMSMLEPLWEMSKAGVRVDFQRLKELRDTLEAEVIEKEVQLAKLCGKVVNTMSPKDMQWLLFDFLKFKPKKTKKKGPSTDDFVLAELGLEAEDPLQIAAIKFIRAQRKARSLISKFCDMERDADGRFRCSFNIGGTATGRLASKQFAPTGTGGNGQNIPRDKRVRKIHIPDPGYVFFYDDLERAESLVVAHLTGDPTMLAHHAPGTDAHKSLASLLFEKPEDQITEEERYLGKQTRHAGNYMEGPKIFQQNVNKLAAQTGVAITLSDAKFFIQKYRDLHPYLTRWWDETAIELRTKGVLYNLLGRPRRFFDRADSSLPTAVAYKPQSTVGDVLNIALRRCHYDPELRRLGVQLLKQIHDAIGGQVPEENLFPAMARMRQLMRVPLINPRNGEEFHIPVEIAVGPSWGEVQKWEEDLKVNVA